MQVQTGTEFKLARAATVRGYAARWTGARLADQAVYLRGRAAHRGSRRGTRVRRGLTRPGQPRHGPAAARRTWDSPFLTAGTDGTHPLLATYGVIIATLFGAIGLPHILVRFYTNPDGEAARRTTLIVRDAAERLLPLPRRAGGADQAARPGAVPVQGPGQRRARPARPCSCPGRPGELLGALVAAGAFAAFLSTSSGLLVSVAGALSHDVMRGGVGTFRLCAIIAGTIATVAALPVNRFSLGLLVGWAFAIAASSFCPLIVLGIWWRRLTWIGATAGVLVGGGACCCRHRGDDVRRGHPRLGRRAARPARGLDRAAGVQRDDRRRRCSPSGPFPPTSST